MLWSSVCEGGQRDMILVEVGGGEFRPRMLLGKLGGMEELPVIESREKSLV